MTPRVVSEPSRDRAAARQGDYFACKMVDEVLAKSLILYLSIWEMGFSFYSKTGVCAELGRTPHPSLNFV